MRSYRRVVSSMVRMLILGAVMVVGAAAPSLACPGKVSKGGPASPRFDGWAGGLRVTWVAPDVDVDYTGEGSAVVRAEGLAHVEEPGLARLPFDTALIAVPPGAEPRLRILRMEEAAMPLRGRVEVAAWPEVGERGGEGRTRVDALGPKPGDGAGTTREALVLEELGVLRGVRLARLRFFPALPDGDSLRVIERLEAEISWEAKTPLQAEGSWLADPIVEQVRRAVVNPGQVVPAAPLSRGDTLRTSASAPTALLEVVASGVYVVRYGDLEGLGFAGVDPRNLRLFWGEEEVAYEWAGDGDAQFEDGEEIIFYAEPRFSRWTRRDVYRLVGDTVNGRRMTLRSASPVGLPEGVVWVDRLVEENELYMPDCFCGSLPTGRDGDRWGWKELFTLGDERASVSFDAPGVDVSRAAELTLWFVGFSDLGGSPNHRVEVVLNGESLGEVAWKGRVVFTATLPISAGTLQASDNVLDVSLGDIPGVTIDGSWLDALSVRYPRSGEVTGASLRFGGEAERRAYEVGLEDTTVVRAYDVTDPLAPQQLREITVEGDQVRLGDPPGGGARRYVLAATSGLKTPEAIRAVRDPWGFNAGGAPGGADVLIITHRRFATSLGALLALRESQGLEVAVVDVEGIYDVWGDGRPDPEVIRGFIGEAYAGWEPVPSYVLLVGDGSFDPRQYQEESGPTFVPPYLADVDPWAGETAADNRYVCVDGGLAGDGEDRLPDMMIGRLPVKTVEETEAVVQKIVRQERGVSAGAWQEKVVLVADDADTAGNFVALAEEEAALVPPSFDVIKYYCEAGAVGADDCPAGRVETIRDGVREDWKKGAWLFAYAGHASWQQWGGPLPFLHLDDLASLGGGRPPIGVALTCFTSAFQRPEATLDESLVTLEEGALATWGSTGLGLTGGHASLAQGFFSAVFEDDVGTMGEADLGGKLHLAATGEDLELLEGFVVLGDPVMGLVAPVLPEEVFLPLVLREG